MRAELMSDRGLLKMSSQIDILKNNEKDGNLDVMECWIGQSCHRGTGAMTIDQRYSRSIYHKCTKKIIPKPLIFVSF